MDHGRLRAERLFGACGLARQTEELVTGEGVDALGDVRHVGTLLGRRAQRAIVAAAGLLRARAIAEREGVVVRFGDAQAVVAAAGRVEVAHQAGEVARAEHAGAAGEHVAQLAPDLVVFAGATAIDADFGVAVFALAPVVAMLPAQRGIHLVLGGDPGSAVEPADMVMRVDEARGDHRVWADDQARVADLRGAIAADAGDFARGVEQDAAFLDDFARQQHVRDDQGAGASTLLDLADRVARRGLGRWCTGARLDHDLGRSVGAVAAVATGVCRVGGAAVRGGGRAASVAAGGDGRHEQRCREQVRKAGGQERNAQIREGHGGSEGVARAEEQAASRRPLAWRCPTFAASRRRASVAIRWTAWCAAASRNLAMPRLPRRRTRR